MTKQIKGSDTIYSLDVDIEASYKSESDTIEGSIDIKGLFDIPLREDTLIEFSPQIYRLMPDKTISKEDGWLVQLRPIAHGSTIVNFSVGGEFLDEVQISEVPGILAKVIFI